MSAKTKAVRAAKEEKRRRTRSLRSRYVCGAREKLSKAERAILAQQRGPTPDAAILWFTDHCQRWGIAVVPVT